MGQTFLIKIIKITINYLSFWTHVFLFDTYVDYEKHGSETVITNTQKQEPVYVHYTLLIVFQSQVDQTEHDCHNLLLLLSD